VAFEKSKALYELKKIQSALSKEIVTVEAGNGAVQIKISGDQKIQAVELDPEKIKDAEIEQIQKWLQSAINQAITKSQQLAMERMKSMPGGLGIPGL
jgi:nucleoid-associated protein EbfC